MAASTGPDSNTYRIPEVELADTFNTWRDISNTQAYKLNKMRVYDGVSSSSISITVAGGGTLQAQIADNVGKGVTFEQPVRFLSGVTFDGDVTFNAQRFTVNANVVTIDDYALLLGDTIAASDASINTAGGGGIFLNRGSGATAQWAWTPTETSGAVGQWTANSHIGLCGASSGIISPLNSPLSVYGQGLRITGTNSADHGVDVSFYGTNTTTGRNIALSRYSPSGSTAFAEVLTGTTYGSRPFFNIKDGANRKTIQSVPGTFVVGTPVRLNSAGVYATAIATDAAQAEVIGVVSAISSTSYEITFLGEIFGDFRAVNEGGGNLIAGQVYYLSPFTPGKITATQPISAGTVHKAVFIATGTNSAVVLPFTGGVLATPVQIANATSVTTTIDQANRFNIGDIVRFRAKPTGSAGITLSYSVGTGKTLEQFYQHGVFVKAQANTEEDAEIAGMVLGVGGATGDAGKQAYQSFDVIIDGFFNLPAGYGYGSLTPGVVYFLNIDCAGTSNGFESATTPYDSTPPVGVGTVRKPLFMATSPVSGYLFSYRGDVRGPVVGVTMADLNQFLVRDLRSSVQDDLNINSYNATTSGRNAVKIAAGANNFSGSVGACAGYVGINGVGTWQSWSGSAQGSRILAPLDVQGSVRVGESVGSSNIWRGRDLIVARENVDTPSGITVQSLNIVGTNYTTNTSGPSLVIGRGVRANANAAGYISSMAGTYARSSLELGVRGNSNLFSWQIAEPVSAPLGTAVSLTEVFSIVGRTASFASGVGIGTATPTVPLDVNGLARSNVAVTAITDPKHLATKEYVDSKVVVTTPTTHTLSGNYDYPESGAQPVGYVITSRTDTSPNIFTITNSTNGISRIQATVGVWIIQGTINSTTFPERSPKTYKFTVLCGQFGDGLQNNSSMSNILGQATINDYPGTFTLVATRIV